MLRSGSSQEHKVMKMQLRLELEFEALDMQRRECLDVEMIRMSEDTRMKPFEEFRDHEYTSANIKAGRKILEALRRLVDAKKNPLPKQKSGEAKIKSNEGIRQLSSLLKIPSIDLLRGNSPPNQDSFSRNPTDKMTVQGLNEMNAMQREQTIDEIILSFEMRNQW